MFTYLASGSLTLGKCGLGYIFDPIYIRDTVFGVGDEAWLKYKAVKGVLEMVVVKWIKIIPQLYQGRGSSIVLYYDTYNAVYNEDDLITSAEALALAATYLQNRIAAIRKAECIGNQTVTLTPGCP